MAKIVINVRKEKQPTKYQRYIIHITAAVKVCYRNSFNNVISLMRSRSRVSRPYVQHGHGPSLFSIAHYYIIHL